MAEGAPRPPLPAAPGQIPELLETLPALLLLAVLCGLDWALYSAFHTIRHHSFLQYSFRSERVPETSPRQIPTPILPIVPPPPGVDSLALQPDSGHGASAPNPLVSAAGRGGKSAAEGRGGFSALTSPRPLHTDFPDTRPTPL